MLRQGGGEGGRLQSSQAFSLMYKTRAAVRSTLQGVGSRVGENFGDGNNDTNTL